MHYLKALNFAFTHCHEAHITMRAPHLPCCVFFALALTWSMEQTKGHGAMVHPRSRNSVDAFLHPLPSPLPHTFAHCINISGGECSNGQSAFWYSQGCFIGCPSCDHTSGRRQTDLCKLGFVGELPTAAISVNGFSPNGTAIERNSVYDIYRHNPWRAPGHAPVADPCGLAGGAPTGGDGPEEGEYVNTTNAQHGMRGTQLPPLPTGVKWKIGSTAEVSWNILYNHGGGYSYRLCPVTPGGEPLTEECFQKHPLDFVETAQKLVYPNGTRVSVKAPVFVRTGTSPKGSMWSRLPLPGSGYGHRCACDLTNDAHGDKPQDYSCGCKKGEERGGCVSAGNCSSGACLPCPETAGSDCSRCDNPPRHAWGGYSFPPPASPAAMNQGPGVLDEVYVGGWLKPGPYVLGFRYDCDSSSQVWQNCADIELVV